MSHVVSMDFRVLDLDAMATACEACGCELRLNQKTHRWYGTWVNDYNQSDAAYRRRIKPQDYGRCEHAIAVKNQPKAYEVGLVKAEDGIGYIPVWDFYAGGHGLVDAIGKDGLKLLGEYTRTVVQKRAAAMGVVAQEITLDDGTRVFRARVPNVFA